MRLLWNVLLAAALLGGLLIWPLGGDTSSQKVSFVRSGSVVGRFEAATLRELPRRRLDRLVSRLTRDRRVRRGSAQLTLVADRNRTRTRIRRALAAGRSEVAIPERAAASRIRVPVLKQAFRNNCETAALAMLLRAAGENIDQLALQERLASSPPLDPRTRSDCTLEWGDPDAGFVGRANGGGPAGGFGVYEGPVRRLAAREGVRLTDLTGRSPARVYDSLLEGRPVMTWIGLTDGPYSTWETREGREIRANFGEHTVVLTGTRAGVVRVNDPLSGTRATWSRTDFELMWNRLGRRALSL